MHLRGSFPDWTITTPLESQCSLTATGNVFGRYVNGVQEADVCLQEADPQNAVGDFIHIEQAAASRNANAYNGWVAAISATYRTTQSTDRSAL
jgi:hypothetical protein